MLLSVATKKKKASAYHEGKKLGSQFSKCGLKLECPGREQELWISTSISRATACTNLRKCFVFQYQLP